jgi:branched-chain amino acid transport system substrate-binding protein
LDPEKVRDALANLDEMTFLGRMKFDKDGSRLGQPQYAVQIQDPAPEATAKIVYPFEDAEARLIYPAVPWDKR